jgi:2-amino-4-hydroxy-6-hydroxymethyldihydropteridine diphosphokinase
LRIESELGRKRTFQWGPREIDLDILIYDNKQIDLPELKVPHPKMHERKFVLIPFSKIAPKIMHPILKKTVEEILSECKDSSRVSLIYENIKIED